MPRRSSRPSSSSSRSAPSGSRSASTSSSVPAHAPPAAPPATMQQQQRGPGLFGQMASTAAGVAVGHAVGHGIVGMFSGGGSGHVEQAAAPAQQSQAGQQQFQDPCANDNQRFIECLQKSDNNIASCQMYFDFLKQCQTRVAENQKYQ